MMLTIGSLRSIDRRVDLDANVEVLSSKEVLSIGREDATQSWARSETLEGLGRGSGSKTHSYSCRFQAEGDHDWLPDKGNELFRVRHLDEETARQTDTALKLFINIRPSQCPSVGSPTTCRKQARRSIASHKLPAKQCPAWLEATRARVRASYGLRGRRPTGLGE
jgi:hypothetical protein